jgi:hypothetical protein
MMNLDAIAQDIQIAYLSSETPNGRFAQTRLEDGMHDSIVLKLSSFCKIFESTDLNDDVSRCVYLQAEGFEVNLRISLVGNYACAHLADGTFLTFDELELSVAGTALLNALRLHKIDFLEESALKARRPFFSRDASTYEILFSSDDLI